jgi:hypothetical protein
VLIDAGTHTMELIVPDEKLSLAIGKKGQNVRLASQLTGWRIDIHSETKVREMEARGRASLAQIEGVTAEMVEALFRLGWRSAADVSHSKPEELAEVAGITAEEAPRMIASARAVEAERRRQAEEAALAAAAQLGVAADDCPPSLRSVWHSPQNADTLGRPQSQLLPGRIFTGAGSAGEVLKRRSAESNPMAPFVQIVDGDLLDQQGAAKLTKDGGAHVAAP